MTHTRLIVLILALAAVSFVVDHGLRKIGKLTDTSGINL